MRYVLLKGLSFVFLLWTGISVPLLASSESIASKCLSTLYRLQEPHLDTAVELEMVTDRPVLSLVTTPTGRVGDFFEGRTVPQGVLHRFRPLKEDDIRQLFWRQLNAWEKLSVLKAVSVQKKSSFFEDRRIPYLKYEDEFIFHTDKDVLFLGRHFSPGRHELPLKTFLKGPIEYMGPENDPEGVELHFRTNRPSGEVSRDARIFQKMLGEAPTHQHVYVVAPIPQKLLEENPEVVAFQNTDFLRRANLAAEMITIVEDDRGISKRESWKGDNLIRLFGWLERQDFSLVLNYYLARARHKEFKIGDQVKIGWIGFRGHDKFDQPDLMGMEVRSVGSSSDMAVMEPFLNTLQKSWVEQKLGLPTEKVEQWLKTRYSGDPYEAIQDNWYHREWSQILANAPEEIKTRLSSWDASKRYFFFETATEETKMLFHDWTKDPIFLEAPAQLHFLIRGQAKALEDIEHGAKSYREIVKKFLIQSGLYERVLKSLKPEN